MVWEISWREFLGMGGPVMGPLVAVALVLSYYLVERFMFLVELRKNDITPDAVINGLAEGGAGQQAGRSMYRELLRRFSMKQKIYGRLDSMILEETVRGFLPEIRKNFTVIACLITAAPLLGLLGTVTGMIHTFNVMNIFGTGNAKAMSSGISEALITTQFGLVIAIIGLYVQLFIERRARKAEIAVDELIRHIIRKCNL